MRCTALGPRHLAAATTTAVGWPWATSRAKHGPDKHRHGPARELLGRDLATCAGGCRPPGPWWPRPAPPPCGKSGREAVAEARQNSEGIATRTKAAPSRLAARSRVDARDRRAGRCPAGSARSRAARAISSGEAASRTQQAHRRARATRCAARAVPQDPPPSTATFTPALPTRRLGARARAARRLARCFQTTRPRRGRGRPAHGGGRAEEGGQDGEGRGRDQGASGNVAARPRG